MLLFNLDRALDHTVQCYIMKPQPVPKVEKIQNTDLEKYQIIKKKKGSLEN